MADYNLAGLSTRSFEQLIQAIALKVVSPGVVVFGDGPDGGREATFNGLTRYPSEDHPWNGYIVIQAKFRQRLQNSQEDGEWALKQLKSELEDFANPKKRRRQPDYYIFATNVVLTPVQDKGTKDKADDIFQEFKDSVPLKGYDIWDYDKIRVFLDNFEDIRRAYTGFITPGDVLSQIMDFIEPRKELFADQYTNSEDIELLVQKVRSHFDKTIQNECETLCTFNLLYSPMRGNLSQIYVQTKLNESQQFSSEEFSQERRLWEEVVRRNSKLIVLGKPGAGKTTLLQYIAVHCDEVDFQSKLIPVFISLKTLAENAKSADEISLIRYICKKYCRSQVSAQKLEVLLKNGRLLFLLDGMDEVIEDKIQAVVKEIHQLVDEYGDNLVIVSCRKEHQAYKSKVFGNFTLCKVADFEQLQIEEFIRNWFFEPPVEKFNERTSKSNQLIKKLRNRKNKRIKELADTPLLLHLICLIYQEKGDLPATKVDLYKEGINLLVEKWNQFNERVQVDVVELRKAVRRIAFITFEQGKSDFNEKEISRLIENNPHKLSEIEVISGLLIRKTWHNYNFSHQTFQEYLVSEELLSEQYGWKKLLSHLSESRWREVFFMVLSQLELADKLIQLMKQQIDGLLADDEKLQQYLIWVNQKSVALTIPCKPVAVRACYFFHALARNFALLELPVLNIEQNSNQKKRWTPELDRVLDPKIGMEVVKVSYYIVEIGLSNILGVALEHAIDTNNFRSLKRNIDMLNELHFQINPAIIELLEQLPLEKSPNKKVQQWWKDNGIQWVSQFRTLMVKHHNIGHDWQFSHQQLKLLKQYYDGNKFLVACLNSGCKISPEVRALIEDNLFLPLDSSPS
ncbi:NACHT domain-containing protein [Halotia wernerae UHCC 0503]|nr:NACHT domain-containing protein [Halotia wernerae UHCC 0503]